ncbi:MAG: DUF3619 family protein [Myxococcota bacterium]|nr:DUF3619 family protein [Myxococcota bacterium]
MSDETREREFLSKTRTVLDAAQDAIDPATRTRLRAARATALAAASARRRSRWVPAAGLLAAASAALVAVAVWRAADAPGPADPIEAMPAPIAATPAEPIPVAAAEDLDLYLDLEFFTWLAEQGDAG